MLIFNGITNKVTGQKICFLLTGEDTEGRSLEMESHYPALSPEPLTHYHPNQEEIFQVLKGELTVRMNGEIKVYVKGDTLCIPKGTPHSMWNAGFGNTIVHWKVMPALDMEYFLTTMMLLANTGRTNKSGIPPLPLRVFLLKKYQHTFRLSNPSSGLLNILFIVLKPVFFFNSYHRQYCEAAIVRGSRESAIS
ncbi:MAG: cupin domain-containing protein [Chitinophagaceae bacterium]